MSRVCDYYKEYLIDSMNNPLSNPLDTSKKVIGGCNDVVKERQMPWEDSPQGRLRWMLHPALIKELNVQVFDLISYQAFIPPGSRSGKHRHMSEEIMYVVDGKGYDLHWDVDQDLERGWPAPRREIYKWKVADTPKKFEWSSDKTVFIPCNTIHQHFNTDKTKPAHLLHTTCAVYDFLGFGYRDMEQIENCPEWKAKTYKGVI